MIHLRLLFIACFILVPALCSGADDDYGYPTTDAYQATILGTPADLKASIGVEGATLDDVFISFTGDKLESGATYSETSRARRTARRLG